MYGIKSYLQFLKSNVCNLPKLFSTQTPLQSAGPMACLLETRSVIRFKGPETIKFLQGLVTNDVRSLDDPEPAGENSNTPNMPVLVIPPVYAAMLTPQGRFLYDFFFYRPPRFDEKLDRAGSGPGPDSVELEIYADVDGSIMDEILATLKRYHLRSKVDIEDVLDDFSCWQRFGGNLASKSSSLEDSEANSVGWGGTVDHTGVSASQGSDLGWHWNKYHLRSKVDIEDVSNDFSCWQRFGGNLASKSSSLEDSEANSVGWGGTVDHTGVSASQGSDLGWHWNKDPRLACLGYRGIFPSNSTPPLVEADKETDEGNFLLWRLEKGVAEGSAEIPKGEAIPLEYNLAGLNAISFDKGCYIGQELIARTHHRGVIRKRLIPLSFLDDSGKKVEQKVSPGSEVIDTTSQRKAGTVTTSLRSRGLGLLRLEEAFKGTGSLTIKGQEDVEVETIRPKWWSSEWFLDHQQQSAAA